MCWSIVASRIGLGLTIVISGCVQINRGVLPNEKNQEEETVLKNSRERKELEDWVVTMQLIEHNEHGLGYWFEARYTGDESIEDITMNISAEESFADIVSTSELTKDQGMGLTIFSVEPNVTEVQIDINWNDHMHVSTVLDMDQKSIHGQDLR